MKGRGETTEASVARLIAEAEQGAIDLEAERFVTIQIVDWEPEAGDVVLVHEQGATYEVELVRLGNFGWWVVVPTTGKRVENVLEADSFVGKVVR